VVFHSSVDGHSGCFGGDVTNTAARHIQEQYFVNMFLILSSIYLGVELLNLKVTVFNFFEALTNYFQNSSTILYYSNAKGSIFSIN
jgi:hypothetical protein